MSDEEKAEEYAKGKAHEHYNFLFEENNGSPIDFAKLCYLDGLAEGRKEATEKNFKEAYQRYVNNSLATFDMKKALEDARDQIRIAKENEELKAQIEKMKCCGNCKHCEFKIVSDGSTRAICTQLKGDVCLSNNYDNWELAE